MTSSFSLPLKSFFMFLNSFHSHSSFSFGYLESRYCCNSYSVIFYISCFLISSSTGTCNSSEILNRVSSDGCVVLVHHLLTVAGSLPNASDSHRAVLLCSTRTTFIRLKSLSSIRLIISAKIQYRCEIFE